MRILPTLLAVVVGLAVFTTLGCKPGDTSGDGESTTLDDTVALLRRCGPMRYGEERTECVQNLQKVLQTRGASLPTTGHYLDETTGSIQEFQAARGLRQDGALDARTLNALIDLPGNSGSWDLRRECVSLRQAGDDDHPGSQGPCVVALHSRLAAQGVEALSGDQFDAATEVAVRSFQEAAGLERVGVVGPLTKQALYTPNSGARSRSPEPSCTLQSCVIYLGRGFTGDMANALPRSDLAKRLVSSGISFLVCSRVRVVPAVNVACQAVGTYILDQVVNALAQAGQQHACLQVRVGYPPGETSWFPLRIAPYTGQYCHD